MRVTRTAVSVVICVGPSLRPSKPFFLSSEVRSDGESVLCARRQAVTGITSRRIVPYSSCQSMHCAGARGDPKPCTQDAAKQEGLELVAIGRAQVHGRGRVQETDA